MAKNKNPKLNEDDTIEEDGMPLEDTTSISNDDDALADDFDPSTEIAEDSSESDEGELTGYTMGEIGLADMETDSEHIEDAKILKEGFKLAKQIESIDEVESDDEDSAMTFDSSDEADIFKDFEDDDTIYDGDDY